MTTTIRAYVRKAPPNSWFAHARATITNDDEIILAGRSSSICYSHPEAMQAAYKLLADLEAELMDEVHASLASRREARA